jgi:hypothetical protein
MSNIHWNFYEISMKCWDTVEISWKFQWNFDGASNMDRTFIEILMKFQRVDIFVVWEFDMFFIQFINLIWKSSAMCTHDRHILRCFTYITNFTMGPHDGGDITTCLDYWAMRQQPQLIAMLYLLKRQAEKSPGVRPNGHTSRDFRPRSTPKRAHITGFVFHAFETSACLKFPGVRPSGHTSLGLFATLSSLQHDYISKLKLPHLRRHGLD